jgi:hypothetical protein
VCVVCGASSHWFGLAVASEPTPPHFALSLSHSALSFLDHNHSPPRETGSHQVPATSLRRRGGEWQVWFLRGQRRRRERRLTCNRRWWRPPAPAPQTRGTCGRWGARAAYTTRTGTACSSRCCARALVARGPACVAPAPRSTGERGRRERKGIYGPPREQPACADECSRPARRLQMSPSRVFRSTRRNARFGSCTRRLAHALAFGTIQTTCSTFPEASQVSASSTSASPSSRWCWRKKWHAWRPGRPLERVDGCGDDDQGDSCCAHPVDILHADGIIIEGEGSCAHLERTCSVPLVQCCVPSAI